MQGLGGVHSGSAGCSLPWFEQAGITAACIVLDGELGWGGHPRSWDEEQLAIVPTKMVVAPVMGLDRTVPDNWEDEVANEAWFDAKDTNVEELPKEEDAVDHALLLANDETMLIGDLLSPRPVSVLASVGGEDDSVASVGDLFTCLEPPLLPLPPARTPASRPAPTSPLLVERRSFRLAAKPIMPAMDKVVYVLAKKMCIEAQDMTLDQARKQYVDSYKSAMPSFAVQAMVALFRLNMPSISASDEALIAMAVQPYIRSLLQPCPPSPISVLDPSAATSALSVVPVV